MLSIIWNLWLWCDNISFMISIIWNLWLWYISIQPHVDLVKEGASGYTWSCTAYIRLPQVDNVQGHTQTHPQLKNYMHYQAGSIILFIWVSGRLLFILIFSLLSLLTRFVAMLLHENSSNYSCYFIGLLSCESIVKPILAISQPYKEVSYFETFYWSRHVSVASSLKGVEFFAAPTVPYIAGHCSFGAEPISPLSINLLLIGWSTILLG